jgi:predicted amidohydrolase YtcJ
LGSLELGKRADLIVLDRDPLEVPPEEIPKVQVLGTMIEGVWVWQASGAQLGGPRQAP